MLFDFFQSNSLVILRVQQACNQIFDFIMQVLREPLVCSLDLLKDLTVVLFVKRQFSTQHGLQNHSNWPNITLRTWVRHVAYYFRCCLVGTPATGLEQFSWLHIVTESKVHNLQIVILVQKQVLRLEVPVDHIVEVAVADPTDYHLEILPGDILFQHACPLDHVLEVPTLSMF